MKTRLSNSTTPMPTIDSRDADISNVSNMPDGYADTRKQLEKEHSIAINSGLKWDFEMYLICRILSIEKPKNEICTDSGLPCKHDCGGLCKNRC